MLHDAHVHIHEKALVDQMKLHDIEVIANASDLHEYQFIKELQRSYDKIHISAGIHPWKADSTNVQEMLPILKECSIIGEIGLDNTWCDCDPKIQADIFEKQLLLACELKKPVILHTKGMEKEVLDLIKKYPNTYLVHWYSSMDLIQEYAELGCFFTIGVSIGKDEAVTQVAKTVSLDHLLLETDGIDAVSWADGFPCRIEDYAKVLNRTIIQTSLLRKIDPTELEKQLNLNFQNFLQKSK